MAAPLGVADELFFGVPASDLGRLARLAVQPSAALYNRADFLTSDVPAGGIVSARAVARLYASLLGAVDGVRLISPARLREISAVAVDDVDQVFGGPSQMALGYSIGGPMSDAQSTSTAFGWSGVGGSHAGADTATGTAFVLTKNLFTVTDFSTVAHVAEIVTKAVTDS